MVAALQSINLDQYAMLEQTAIDEAALLDYPLARRPAGDQLLAGAGASGPRPCSLGKAARTC